MTPDSPDILTTREEALAVIADSLRDTPVDERAAFMARLIDVATDPDEHPTLRRLGRLLAPVLLRMEVGDDPLDVLLEAPAPRLGPPSDSYQRGEREHRQPRRRKTND